jgi:Amt family ammonium transporter
MGGQLRVQLIGVVATVAYTAAATWIILKVVGLLTGGLRVGADQEIEGLDIVLHEERGYNIL